MIRFVCLSLAAIIAAPSICFGQCGGPSMGGMGMGGCGMGSMGSCGNMGSPMMFMAPMQQHRSPQSKPIEIAQSIWAPQGQAAKQQLPERTMDFFVNVERQRQGLPPVKVTATLNSEARKLVNGQASKAELVVPGSIANAVSARHSEDPAAIMKAWMKNSDFASKILSSDYKTCGFASARDSEGQVYWTLVMGN